VLLLFSAKYYSVNIGAEAFRIPDRIVPTLNMFLIYLFIIGYAYASLGLFLTLLDKRIGPILRRRAVVATCLLVAGIFLEPLLPDGSMAESVHFLFYDNFGLGFIVLELGLMITLPVKAGGLGDRRKTRVARALAYLYLSRYPVIALFVLVPQPLRLLLALLYLNLAPYAWYRFFALPQILRTRPADAAPLDLDGIVERGGLSPRETEILGLIMEGKSNRDMEEMLFISYHTVKNHVYNIYRKLGVKTRF